MFLSSLIIYYYPVQEAEEAARKAQSTSTRAPDADTFIASATADGTGAETENERKRERSPPAGESTATPAKKVRIAEPATEASTSAAPAAAPANEEPRRCVLR